MSQTCDVVVVGAGLAGLQCARELETAGRDVQVWEAADDVGGRIRTDHVDGFLVDRGFQVLNPAYPAVRRMVDVDALQLNPFGAGLAVRLEDRLALLGHPIREPRLIPATLRSGLVTPVAVARLARWGAPALGPPSRVKSAPDRTLRESLDAAHVTGTLRRVVDQFFAGVLLDDRGDSSRNFAMLLLRMFALGVPGLPSAGMQALPRQLAGTLRTPVRTATRVDRVVPRDGRFEVVGQAATTLARQVVVATDPSGAGPLTGLPTPATKGVLTYWFAADTAPTASDLLFVDGRAAPGPLVNTAVMTNAAPTYAPPGRHLIQASALIHRGSTLPTDEDVRRHAAQIYGAPTHGWQVVARHEVTHALPAQPPPLDVRRPLKVAPGLFVAGDHRDTASIQGALVSGHRAARMVLAEDMR